jgi:hypothetical protein
MKRRADTRSGTKPHVAVGRLSGRPGSHRNRKPITGRLLACRLGLSIRLYDFVVPVWLPPKEHGYPQIVASSTDGRSPLASLTLARFWPSYG